MVDERLRHLRRPARHEGALRVLRLRGKGRVCGCCECVGVDVWVVVVCGFVCVGGGGPASDIHHQHQAGGGLNKHTN